MAAVSLSFRWSSMTSKRNSAAIAWARRSLVTTNTSSRRMTPAAAFITSRSMASASRVRWLWSHTLPRRCFALSRLFTGINRAARTWLHLGRASLQGSMNSETCELLLVFEGLHYGVGTKHMQVAFPEVVGIGVIFEIYYQHVEKVLVGLSYAGNAAGPAHALHQETRGSG